MSSAMQIMSNTAQTSNVYVTITYILFLFLHPCRLSLLSSFLLLRSRAFWQYITKQIIPSGETKAKADKQLSWFEH
jgi:hypothetical protein